MRLFWLSMIMVVCAANAAAAGDLAVRSAELPYIDGRATCDVVIANLNYSKSAKLNAAFLYMSGRRFGERCFEPVYVRAFELFDELGATKQMRYFLRDLESRAAGGSHYATTVLGKLQKAGFTK